MALKEIIKFLGDFLVVEAFKKVVEKLMV